MASMNELNAAAVMGFVDTMIGALESGFVDKNNPTLAEVHQFARTHIKFVYGVDYPDIVTRWGKDVAELCGTGEAS